MPTYGGTKFTEGNEFNWGEALAVNKGLNVLVNTNFMLRVEGLYDVPCRKVSSFQRENEFEYIQEGGLNDYVHMKRKNISKPFVLTIERYTGNDWFDILPLGYESILPMVLIVSKYPGLFTPTKVARMYTFTGCTIISKTWGELNAEDSGLLVETLEIAYREFAVINQVANAVVEDREAIKAAPRRKAKEPGEKKPKDPYTGTVHNKPDPSDSK